MGCLKLERLEQEWTPLKVIHKAERTPKNRHVNYYPFGAEHSTSKTGDFAYRYNGKEKELGLDLGLLRYGARDFDPWLGSFTGVDPLSDHPDQVHKSPYVYASNNPIRYQDFEGLLPVDANQGPGDPPLGAVIAGTIRAGYLQIGYNTVRRFKIWGGADPSSIPYRRFSVHEDATSATGVSVGYEDIYEEPSVGRKVLDNTLAVLDVAAITPSNGLATFAKTPGMFGSEFIKNASSAFQEAFAGGRHSGFLDNVIKTGAKIDKSIRKKTRRIGEHLSYINDPTLKYGDQWNTFDKARKSREIGHWRSEIKTFSEQIDILNDIKKSGN